MPHEPRPTTIDYQSELAARGAFIEYDMIGMDFFYADQQVQCPSDEEAARAIVRLVDAGFTDRILLSHDVFLKMMLTRYGGNGYAYHHPPLPAASAAARRWTKPSSTHDARQSRAASSAPMPST